MSCEKYQTGYFRGSPNILKLIKYKDKIVIQYILKNTLLNSTTNIFLILYYI